MTCPTGFWDLFWLSYSQFFENRQNKAYFRDLAIFPQKWPKNGKRHLKMIGGTKI